MILNVTTHSGLDDMVEVGSYDPISLAEQRNNNEIEAIVIGENVYSRIDLKNVRLIKEVLEN
jgi:hypothetical protein